MSILDSPRPDLSSLFLTEDTATLYQSWDGLRRGRAFPAWTDIEPVVPDRWRASAYIIDYPERESDIGRYTWVGDAFIARFRKNYTGMRTDEVYNVPQWERLHGTFTRVRRSGLPIVSLNAIDYDGALLPYERILLPFVGQAGEQAGGPADRLLGFVQFGWDDPDAADWMSRVRDLAFEHEAVLRPQDGLAADLARDLAQDLVLRNVRTERGRTSIKLEPSFWSALRDIARARETTIDALVAEIDAVRGGAPLTRAVRLFIMHWFRQRATR